MVKVKAINRSETECTRERSQDLRKVHKNLDPALHPFERAVEYTRALNAVKLDRVFAKPFVAAFPHQDGVNCLARNPKQLNGVVSGSADGLVQLWDVAGKRCLRRYPGHEGAVTGVSITSDGLACAQVDIWDHNRSDPVSSLPWGSDTVMSVRFNPAEPDLIASTATDRSLVLYDLRSSTAVRKLIMRTKSNAVAWNPREAFNLTVANEDCCLYTFDIRKLKTATCVHKDFVSAVMDVDYAPTGREFVAGGYDRSVRIFAHNGGHSREVYHTKRMQRVMAVRFSGDASYVFSGSDDMNLRVWKANASEAQGRLLPRQLQQRAYNAALIKRFRHLPEIRRIERHRHLPAPLYKAARLRRTMIDADRRRQDRRIAHSAPGSVKIQPARKARIIEEQE
ncbi:hypothetical protein WJX73_005000 [Symbiochloris irregularis]|uniref:DDB1- and CUL4-associated factor 13 n=1 Tax=Symbiochloris irregularis TaxID=706552 RepID=A0AAW1NXQ0_9CHLO